MSGRAASSEDLAVCLRLLREGSKSFHAASLLLPRRLRGPTAAVYAFCRVADDVIDEGDDPVEGLRSLRVRLDGIYGGSKEALEDPVDRAFAHVVVAYDIPREIPEALLEGFAWDAEARRYETLAEVIGYSARVASSVGVMMTLVMGPRSREVLARACDLGVAMQLTNIARDVGEDARRKRIYLPEAWLREEGVQPERWLASPAFEPGVGRAVSRLLGIAEGLYRQAARGVPWLPADCQASIRAASLIYEDIGQVIKARGFDSVSRRAVVPGARKLALALKAQGVRLEHRETLMAPPLPEVAFLLEGVRR